MSDKLIALKLLSACQLKWEQRLEFHSNSLQKGLLNAVTSHHHTGTKYINKGKVLDQSLLCRYCVRGDIV